MSEVIYSRTVENYVVQLGDMFVVEGPRGGHCLSTELGYAPSKEWAESVAIRLNAKVSKYTDVTETVRDVTTVIDPDSPLSFDARLLKIYVGDFEVQGFIPTYSGMYEVELPKGTVEVPEIWYEKAHPNSTVEIASTGNIEDEVVVTVTAENGITQRMYKLKFKVPALSENNYLSVISVDYVDIEGFNKEVTEYEHRLEYFSSSFPSTVTATAEDANATVEEPVLEEDNELIKKWVITVTSESGSIRTYTVTFTKPEASTDSSLESISVGGTELEGFDKDVYEYSVELTEEQVVDYVNTINATPAHLYASAAMDIDEEESKVIITVTAEDGESQTVYTLNYTVA